MSGRFINAEDRISIGANATRANLYTYTQNTPVCAADSNGTDAYWLTDINNVYGFGHTSLLIENNNTGKWYYFYWGPEKMQPFDKPEIQLIEIGSIPLGSNGYLDLAALNTLLGTMTIADKNEPQKTKKVYSNNYECAAFFRGNTVSSYQFAESLVSNGNLGGYGYNVLGVNCMQVSSAVMLQSFKKGFEKLIPLIIPNDAMHVVNEIAEVVVTDYSNFAPSFFMNLIIESIKNHAQNR